MLELKNIKKDYLAGENTVHALKGIDLKFRSNEFVSILGQSGCGKTTMLNIIGGLDKYTEGDLIINGRSTKDYKDRDWDTYRNHSIGFVFQSYNLIPHQTVLQNVEIALTLSGVGKAERKERAIKALEEVGLGNQLHKKPSEMSGGQMQRVAIARALVNNPDIILADEPTGALDTETSVQVMEILKKIANDRLIIMVTHNPELAEKYSTRIIRMLDGKVIDDSMPLSVKECQEEELHDKTELENAKKQKKPSMSFFTAFSLSLKNLFTKKGRTTLTAFAGSIGIIGIALILAISQGLTGYINDIQENALSSYPLTIEEQSTDMTSLMQTFMNIHNEDGNSHENDAVYKRSAIYDIMNALSNTETYENDLKSFKAYVEDRYENDEELRDAINGISYGYDLELLCYTQNVDGKIIKSDATEVMYKLMSDYMGVDMSALTNAGNSSSPTLMSMTTMGMGSQKTWEELLAGDDGELVNDLVKKQYDLVYGNWPQAYDEIVLVVDQNNELDDITLYALGLENEETMQKIMDTAMNGGSVEADNDSWSFEDICASDYRVILNSNCYKKDEITGFYSDLRETDAGLQLLYNNALKLKIVGIIKPDPDAETTMLQGSIGYTKALTEYVINQSHEADSITTQLENPTIDVISGKLFHDTTTVLSAEEKQETIKTYINSLNTVSKANLYVSMMSTPGKDYLAQATNAAMAGLTRADMEATLSQAMTQQMGISPEEVAAYTAEMSDDEIAATYKTIVEEQVKAQYAAEVEAQLSAMSTEELAATLDMTIDSYTAEQCEDYYDNVLEFSESTYDDNLKAMGYIDLDSPAKINLFASSFANKDVIEDMIKSYNKTQDDDHKIQYTDYVGIMMSSVNSIINAITYILIAFVAISLIVSSIMIGVITLISVQERTKEIGILRAIGASKRDVSSMFNAETVIIGFWAGFLGIIVTLILCIPINMIIHSVTGINSLNAVLPFGAGVILILISIFLTLIAGIIPSRSAAKKDPVIALRSE